MRCGTWEWIIEFCGGSSSFWLAVFEGPPSPDHPLTDPHALRSRCDHLEHRCIRGVDESGAPKLDVQPGQQLRVRYVSAAGTVDASVAGRGVVRVFDGVRGGNVRAGFFLVNTTRIRLISFAHVGGAARILVRCFV